eukprot:SAG11_NODE_1835_length_4188_cov_2.482514_3_plen_162_part_00
MLCWSASYCSRSHKTCLAYLMAFLKAAGLDSGSGAQQDKSELRPFPKESNNTQSDTLGAKGAQTALGVVFGFLACLAFCHASLLNLECLRNFLSSPSGYCCNGYSPHSPDGSDCSRVTNQVLFTLLIMSFIAISLSIISEILLSIHDRSLTEMLGSSFYAQ